MEKPASTEPFGIVNHFFLEIRSVRGEIKDRPECSSG
jgi:hypothetical protein